MKEEVLDFIKRRFPIDNNWCNGNCYWFAYILKGRFHGQIYYETVNNHFITKIDNKFYDWHGEYQPQYEIYLWEEYIDIDNLDFLRLFRDCVR